MHHQVNFLTNLKKYFPQFFHSLTYSIQVIANIIIIVIASHQRYINDQKFINT
jgi:hypothetical protein